MMSFLNHSLFLAPGIYKKANEAEDDKIINDYKNLGDKLNKKKEEDKKTLEEINKTIETKLTENITK